MRARRPGPTAPYGPKDRPARCHLLTSFAKRVLDAAKSRTGQNESTIVEHLVRKYGGTVQRDEFAATE